MNNTNHKNNSSANKTSTLSTADIFSSPLKSELNKIPRLPISWSSINSNLSMSRVHPKKGTLLHLTQEIIKHKKEPEKETHGILLGTFKKDYRKPKNPQGNERKYPRRRKNLVDMVYGIGFDHDHNCEQNLLDWANNKLLPGSLAILHSSPNDGVNGKLKFRTICLYSRPVTNQEHEIIAHYLYDKIPNIDPCCHDASRVFWTMRSPEGGTRAPWLHVREGAPLDVDLIISRAKKEWDVLEKETETRRKERLKEARQSHKEHHKNYKATQKQNPKTQNKDKRYAQEQYTRRALESAKIRILTAPHGERHRTILREASGIGNLVGGGYLSFDEAERHLLYAAKAIYGSPSRHPDAVRAVREALEHGIQNPRDLSHIGSNRMRGGGRGNSPKRFNKKATAQFAPRRRAKTRYATPPNIPDHKRLLCLRWSLGAGKTRFLQQLSKKYERVLGYSPRISLSRELSERMGFLNYQDIQGPITQDKVIVTINSVGRISLQPNEDNTFGYDILLLDEPEQSLPVIYGNKMIKLNDSGQSYEDLRLQMRSAKLVVLADAYLTQETINTVSRMMGLSDEEILISNHHYIDPRDRYVLYKEREQIINKIDYTLGVGKRLAIPCTLRADVEAIGNMLKEKYPEKRILCIHSKAEDEARATLKNPNETWTQYDAVIYSPTVSSGISFDIPNYFDHIMLVAATVPGIRWTDLMQQLHRVRHPKDRTFYAWIDPYTYDNLVIDRAELREEFLLGKIQTKRILCRYDERTGKRHPHNEEHFEAWLDFQTTINRRYKKVRESFISYLEHNGISYIEPPSYTERSQEADAKGEPTEAAKQAQNRLQATRAVFNNQKRENNEARNQRVMTRTVTSPSEAKATERKPNATLEERETAQKTLIQNFFGEIDLEILKETERGRLKSKVINLTELSLYREGNEAFFVALDRKDWNTGFDLHLKHRTLRLELLDQLVGVVEEEHPQIKELIKQMRCSSPLIPHTRPAPLEGQLCALETKGTSFVGATSSSCTSPHLDINTRQEDVQKPLSPLPPSPHSEWEQERRRLAEERLRVIMNAPQNTLLLRQLGISNMMRKESEGKQRKDPYREQIGAILASLGFRTQSKQFSIGGKRRRFYFVDMERYEKIHRISRRFHSRLVRELHYFEADRHLLEDTGTR